MLQLSEAFLDLLQISLPLDNFLVNFQIIFLHITPLCKSQTDDKLNVCGNTQFFSEIN